VKYFTWVGIMTQLFVDRLDYLLEQMQNTGFEGSLGNSLPVEFEQDLADKYGISKFGRMTLDGDSRVYHAGPSRYQEVDKVIPDSAPTKIFDMVASHIAGQEVDWTTWFMNDPPPRIFQDNKESKMVADYEKAYALDTHKSTKDVILVNPSEGMLHRLSSISTKVCTTSVDPEVLSDLEMKMRKFDPPYVFVGKDLDGEYYHGSNGPPLFQTKNYFSMGVNPNASHQVYGDLEVDDQGLNQIVRYKRKGRPRQLTYYFDEHYKTWSPASLDAHLSLSKRSFFCWTTRKLERRLSEAVGRRFYMAASPPLSAFPGDETAQLISYEGNLLYDVAGGGTWCSRYLQRVQAAKRLGLVLARPQKRGAYFVTYTSDTIERDHTLFSVDGSFTLLPSHHNLLTGLVKLSHSQDHHRNRARRGPAYARKNATASVFFEGDFSHKRDERVPHGSYDFFPIFTFGSSDYSVVLPDIHWTTPGHKWVFGSFDYMMANAMFLNSRILDLEGRVQAPVVPLLDLDHRDHVADFCHNHFLLSDDPLSLKDLQNGLPSYTREFISFVIEQKWQYVNVSDPVLVDYEPKYLPFDKGLVFFKIDKMSLGFLYDVMHLHKYVLYITKKRLSAEVLKFLQYQNVTCWPPNPHLEGWSYYFQGPRPGGNSCFEVRDS